VTSAELFESAPLRAELADTERVALGIVAAARQEAMAIVARAHAEARAGLPELTRRTLLIGSATEVDAALIIQTAATRASTLRTEAAEEALRIQTAATREAERIRTESHKAAVDATRRLDRRRSRLERDLRVLYRERDAERRALDRQFADLRRLSVPPKPQRGRRRLGLFLVPALAVGVGAMIVFSSSTVNGGAPAASAASARAPLCPIPAQYRSSFVSAASKEQVPLSLLTAVATVESRFEANAQSAKGAIGLTQVLPSTARGLRINASTPAANVLAGATYLRQMIDQFGDTRTALAAYNAGPNAVRLGQVGAQTNAYAAAVMSKWASIQNCR
jgi:soluble lytic murein transglycosylase-like protein